MLCPQRYQRLFVERGGVQRGRAGVPLGHGDVTRLGGHPDSLGLRHHLAVLAARLRSEEHEQLGIY